MAELPRLNGIIKALEEGKVAFISGDPVASTVAPFDGAIFEMEHGPYDINVLQNNLLRMLNPREIAKREKVRFLYHDVIYHLTDEIRKEMAGELGPERIETVVGRAEVKDVFPAGKRDKAAGLLVLEGVIRKGLHARLTRADVIVSATTIASLRRFKDDVAEVRAGLECGVVLSDTNDIKAGDNLEVFEVEMRERTL